MKLSKAVEGFTLDCAAGDYSPKTIQLYRGNLRILVDWIHDKELENITPLDLTHFMSYIRTEYKPSRFGGDTRPLSASAVDNYWKALRSFFRWCKAMLGIERPDMNLKRPRYQLPEVVPFTEKEIKALVRACDYTKRAATDKRRAYRMRRPTAKRDRDLLLLMIDTGLRLGEVCRLTVKDVNLENGEIRVLPHGSGIKSKPRTVHLGRAARQAIWHHLADREDAREDDPVFCMAVRTVQSFVRRLGERAGVKRVHAHRFRHTFAIQYLRNGGDVFTLQRLLGHSSLEMVRHYLAIAQTDTKDAHRRASPADRWRL